jgi:MFS family permease
MYLSRIVCDDSEQNHLFRFEGGRRREHHHQPLALAGLRRGAGRDPDGPARLYDRQRRGAVHRSELGGSYADVQWISAAYTLAMAVMLLTGGRLGDMFGRKRMLLIGAAGFTLASVACAIAPSTEALIAFRALQGGLGAVMVPQVFGLIRDLFAPQEMAKAFGILGPACGLAAILGPVVSGLLIDADLFGTGWRMIFLVNVPVGVFVLIAGAKLLPSVPPSAGSRRLDLASVGLAAVGAFMLIYPLVQGRELGWPLWVKAVLVAAVPVLGAFAWLQVHHRDAGATPLIEAGIFAKRSYVSGIAFAMVFLAAMGGITLTLGVFLQAGLGYSPIHAALTTAPFALGGFLGSGMGATLMNKVGRTVVQAGLVVMGLGLLALYAAVAHAGTGRQLGLRRTAAHLRPRHGHGVGADVRDHRRRRRQSRGRLGFRRAAGRAAAGHVAGRHRDRVPAPQAGTHGRRGMERRARAGLSGERPRRNNLVRRPGRSRPR